MSAPVLCYVDPRNEACAYFTTCPLSEQWGDDWDDAPYEHNAGQPYEWAAHRKVPEYEITRVYFDADLESPRSGQINSKWCVRDINAGKVAWLASPSWSADGLKVIHAGTTLEDFCRAIEALGGTVYLAKAVAR